MSSDQEQIEELRARLSGLIERADLGEDARVLAAEALEELAVAIEEIQSQNNELVASRVALEEQAQRSQELFEMVADGYLTTNAEGIIREVNRSACELFGYPRRLVIGRPLASFVEPADRPAFYTQLNRIRGADAGGHVTVHLAVHDHDPIPTSLRATQAASLQDGETRIMWLVRDRRHDLVTDALRSSEERLRTLFDSADVGILLCDTDGRIVFINEQASALLDRPRDDLSRDTWLTTMHPDDRDEVEAAIERALRRRELTSLRHRIAHRDGSEVWVDHSITAFLEEGEVPTGFVSTLVDVTVERTAMAELAASQSFTEALLDTAGVLIVVVDREGTIVRFNRAAEAASGFAAAELIGQHVTCLLPQDQRADTLAVIAELSNAAPAHVSGTLDNEWSTADGRRRRISWTYTTVPSGDGDIALVGTGIDVTDRLLLESQLAQADRLESIGRLTAGVAHDFNNTLTTLRLRIDRLSARDLDADSRSDLAAATATIDRTQQLIADLLSFSSRGPSTPVPVVLASEVQRVIEVLTDLLRGRVTIELELRPASATVTIDPARLEQSLTNLVLNAYDAMPDGGTLRIATSLETVETLGPVDSRVPPRLDPGEYVVLSISDTGIGIEPAELPHVFDPYYTTKSPGRGTGLGLATTYGTITQSGGAITVESAPGRGSTFHVWLPLTAADADATRDEQPTGDSGPTILVVDDDDDLRQVLVEELTRLGYRTLGAGTAAGAFAFLDEPVDALVCDVQLPDLDGSQVAARFGDRHRDLVVVYISGADRSRLNEVLAPGSSVLEKPFTVNDLVAALSAERSRLSHPT